eukprot:TRINITY_DN1894_c0_g1_i3.p1 TRINITY_DN1894_c0_g1~~TRINITY_DN1894_c0_g1_i3.p1  ORF type:complete len:131 (-),score=21.72 TRINITY_DN1894_c0_g1_i3:28-420(-)
MPFSIVADVEQALVAEPVRVQHIPINYATKAKQIDVKGLKSTLHTQLTLLDQRAKQSSVEDRAPVRFSELLHELPRSLPLAEAENLSVPMSFICLLHLANEHGLAITGTQSMDELSIVTAAPQAQTKKHK